MKTSCLTHPAGDPLLVVHAWQVQACDGDACAAMLLSLFEFYHNLKLEQQEQARKMNEVAEFHGDAGQQYTGLLQWHNEEELKSRLLGIYGIKSIRNGLQLLVNKGYISIQSNPNPRYHFDRTRYILFHPEPLQSFLTTYTPDQAKVPDASGKNASPSGKNASPSGKNASPIFMTSPMTSSMNEDPLPPAEMGAGSCAAATGEATNGTMPMATSPHPSRADGTNPRALERERADAEQQAEDALRAQCHYCDAKGWLWFLDARQERWDAKCPHDLPKILAYVASHAYTWPAAPPAPTPTDHGPAPPGGAEGGPAP